MDFYQEFKKLVMSRPHIAINSSSSQNCDFGDYIFRSKNIYVSYFMNDCEDCYYSEYLTKSKDCTDCNYVSASELCYECVDGSGLYNCNFLQDCHSCSNCDYCIDCLNCKDCFGCMGLRQQRFCIFNKLYSEEDYQKKVNLLRKNPPLKILEILMPEFDKHPRLFCRMLKGGENSLGDYIYFSKNCYKCFSVHNVEDAAYVTDILNPEYPSKDCADCDFVSNVELCYECQALLNCTNCDFSENCASSSDCSYCRFCYNCRNCFGCAYLMNKEYCILNRQFTRDEYLAALKSIKNSLKQSGTYGKPLADILK